MTIASTATEYQHSISPLLEGVKYMKAVDFTTADDGHPVLYLF
jgi:hypothetical protein